MEKLQALQAGWEAAGAANEEKGVGKGAKEEPAAASAADALAADLAAVKVAEPAA